MKSEAFEDRMRTLEYFHALRLLPGAWPILRVDGRGFTRFTEKRFEKPFDPRFRDVIVRTAQALLEQLQGIYAYTESDEISILFRPLGPVRPRAGEGRLRLRRDRQRHLHPRVRRIGPLRQPGLAGRERGAGRGLFPMAADGRDPLRAERLVLLDAAPRRQERPGSHTHP